jgi:hypothetical protein
MPTDRIKTLPSQNLLNVVEPADKCMALRTLVCYRNEKKS